jgi:hypothetical protein
MQATFPQILVTILSPYAPGMGLRGRQGHSCSVHLDRGHVTGESSRVPVWNTGIGYPTLHSRPALRISPFIHSFMDVIGCLLYQEYLW